MPNSMTCLVFTGSRGTPPAPEVSALVIGLFGIGRGGVSEPGGSRSCDWHGARGSGTPGSGARQSAENRVQGHQNLRRGSGELGAREQFAGAITWKCSSDLEPVSTLLLGDLHSLQKILPRVEHSPGSLRPWNAPVNAASQPGGHGDSRQNLFQVAM